MGGVICIQLISVGIVFHFSLKRQQKHSYREVLSCCPTLDMFSQHFILIFCINEQHFRLILTLTHREFKLVLFISGHKRPPAFDPLLFEDGDHGHLCFICHHLDGALLGSLCTTGKTVQVQLNCTF